MRDVVQISDARQLEAGDAVAVVSRRLVSPDRRVRRVVEQDSVAREALHEKAPHGGAGDGSAKRVGLGVERAGYADAGDLAELVTDGRVGRIGWDEDGAVPRRPRAAQRDVVLRDDHVLPVGAWADGDRVTRLGGDDR